MTRVSLKFLASELGLAEGTVSRALNNYPDISQETQERVRKCADKYGYRANYSARRLAKGIAEAVAYLMPANTSALKLTSKRIDIGKDLGLSNYLKSSISTTLA